MGDTTKKSETKTEMEKIEKTEKEGLGSAKFEELRDDLFQEAAKLVSEDPSTRIAILITPPAGSSDGSIHSFANPSVEGVLQSFLEDKRPVPVSEEEEEEDASPPRWWWEDEKLLNSNDPEELKAALESMSRMQAELRARGIGSPEREPKP